MLIFQESTTRILASAMKSKNLIGHFTGRRMMVKHMPQKPDTQLLIYQTESGDTKIEFSLEEETVWLTQKLTAELFQTTPQNTILHLKNIFEEGELEEKAICKDFLIVQNEGDLLPEATIRKYRSG
jgi:hypothetical protein